MIEEITAGKSFSGPFSAKGSFSAEVVTVEAKVAAAVDAEVVAEVVASGSVTAGRSFSGSLSAEGEAPT